MNKKAQLDIAMTMAQVNLNEVKAELKDTIDFIPDRYQPYLYSFYHRLESVLSNLEAALNRLHRNDTRYYQNLRVAAVELRKIGEDLFIQIEQIPARFRRDLFDYRNRLAESNRELNLALRSIDLTGVAV